MSNESLEQEIADINTRMQSLNRKFEQQGAIDKVLLGKLLAKLNADTVNSIQEAEFRVFSQFGDDGIIQYLVSSLNIQQKRFIEFGVENYNESNTRFLLEGNNWEGLVLDGSQKHIDYIRGTQNYWRHQLTAQCCFVTAENINDIFIKAGFTGDIGLLHIDIDGNDYWVWKAIEVISPIIVAIEYNSAFGSERSITIPYDPKFARFKHHHSGLYAGASLPALCHLAMNKGYDFIGCNSAGNNAYFVRSDRMSKLTSVDVQSGYVAAKFREHRDQEGNLTFTPASEAIESIRGMPVYNILSDEIEPF